MPTPRISGRRVGGAEVAELVGQVLADAVGVADQVVVEQVADGRFADRAGDRVAAEGVARPELDALSGSPQKACATLSAIRIAERGA